MLVIGLTGGIASGKSAVSSARRAQLIEVGRSAFARRGVPIIDTDVVARELVSPGQPALDEIIAGFGPESLNPDGTLNRAWLRRAVFADPSLRRRLESILHPRIRQAVQQRLKTLSGPYCLVVIPLLIESGMSDMVHRILVVDVPETTQIHRLMVRDRVDEAHARCILAAQASREQRLSAATEIIDNSSGLCALEEKVSILHAKYLALASHSDLRCRPRLSR